MHNQRPVYLNLLQIRQPIAAVLSITHRITGVVLVVAIPLLAWFLGLSLSGAAGFARTAQLFDGPAGTALLLVLLWTVLHHLLGGVRYLLLDVEIGVDRPAYRYSAWTVLLAAPVLAILLVGLIR